MSFPKRIYFTGFMGAGKTTIGLMVANTIGYDFLDLDAHIEETEGKTIPEIFRVDGEPHFRDVERRLLTSTLNMNEVVVAVGGGALASEAALSLLDRSSMVVYLKADPSTLALRLRHGRTDRPLALDPHGNRLETREMEKRVRTMLEERRPYYEQADVVVHSNQRPIGSTVDEVVRQIRSAARRR